jgi:hypothetical protein
VTRLEVDFNQPYLARRGIDHKVTSEHLERVVALRVAEHKTTVVRKIVRTDVRKYGNEWTATLRNSEVRWGCAREGVVRFHVGCRVPRHCSEHVGSTVEENVGSRCTPGVIPRKSIIFLLERPRVVNCHVAPRTAYVPARRSGSTVCWSATCDPIPC